MVQAIRLELDRSSRRKLRKIESEDSQKKKLYEEIRKYFDRKSSIIAGYIGENLLSGQRLSVRSGDLRRSLTGRGELIRGLPAIRVGIFRGPATVYAGVQEFGTQGYNPESPYPTIRPRSAKALTFPIPEGPAVTPTGQHRYSSAREYPRKLKFIPFRESGIAVGGLYDMESYQEEAMSSRFDDRGINLRNVTLVYLLLREVDIKPSFFLRDGLNHFVPEISTELSQLISNFAERKVVG